VVAEKFAATPSLLGEGVLKAGRLAFLYGVGGGSKSWVVLQCALAIASGKEWCGLKTTRGRVGIISFEMFAEEFQERLKAIGPADGVGLEDIFVICRDSIGSLRLPGDGQRIIEWAKERELSLIVIDPLADALEGPETNDCIAPVIDMLKQISLETKAAVIVVHHSRKGDPGRKTDDPLDALRGPSQLRDRADLLMYVERKSSLRRLTFTKVRSAQEPDPIWVDALGRPAKPPETATSQSEERARVIRQLFEDNPDRSFSDEQVVQELHLRGAKGPLKPQSLRKRHLPKLVEQGLLTEISGRGQKDKKLWKWKGKPS